MIEHSNACFGASTRSAYIYFTVFSSSVDHIEAGEVLLVRDLICASLSDIICWTVRFGYVAGGISAQADYLSGFGNKLIFRFSLDIDKVLYIIIDLNYFIKIVIHTQICNIDTGFGTHSRVEEVKA